MSSDGVLAWIKKATIHDSLNLHKADMPRCLISQARTRLGVCVECNHIITWDGKRWSNLNTKIADSISGYEFLFDYPELDVMIKIYEHLEYLKSSVFAFHFARDIIKKPTTISRRIAGLDELYQFHYANEIDKRTTAEKVKAFHQLFRQKIEQSNSS